MLLNSHAEEHIKFLLIILVEVINLSYVEKAFWDYLKSTLFGGVRILLSRQLILFSLILVVISISTTGIVFIQEQASDLITPELVQLAFNVQLSLAIGLMLSGLISKKLNIFGRFILMIFLVMVVLAIFLLSNQIEILNTLSTVFTESVPLLTFLCWSFLIPIASFSFAKGMLSNKVTGSILFLGKPRNERKSIFSGVLTLIALFSAVGNGLMVGTGLNELRLSYILLGGLGFIASIFIIFIVLGLIFSDDVFNTIIGFFFVMTLPNHLMIVLTSISGSTNIVTTFDFVLVAFTLLYSAQGISRRIKMKGVVVNESGQVLDPKKDDPFRIGRFVGLIGGEGIVLIYLGLALGFHLVQLQVISGTASIYENLFGTLSFSEAYHDITSIFAFLILTIVVLTYSFQRGRGYWKTDIYRFDFLPPYDELKDYIEKVKRGEISKTDVARTVGKKVSKTAVGVGSSGVTSVAKMLRDRIFRNSENDTRRN